MCIWHCGVHGSRRVVGRLLPDCKQVCIALVVTFDGFPLGYEVFANNTHDSRTLQTIVATMEARHGLLGRAWITDRGMASAAKIGLQRAAARFPIALEPAWRLRMLVKAERLLGWKARNRMRDVVALLVDAERERCARRSAA
jgi:hypothetical protein